LFELERGLEARGYVPDSWLRKYMNADQEEMDSYQELLKLDDFNEPEEQ
jgi:hypothetical protein